LDVPALSQEQKERWSLEIFSLATKDIRPSHYRAAMQKNALVALCKVNPEKAAALYTTQDTPEMWHQDVLMEDYRAFGARTLFPALWAQSRMASIPTIRSIANWIGSTGEYPFAAVAIIIQDIPKSHDQEAETLASDAIASYRTTESFLNKASEFTNFILAIHKRVRPTLIRQAIEAELASLDALEKSDEHAHVVIRAASSQQTVQFSKLADYVVYRLLPIMELIDPAWAQSVRDKYAVVRNVPSQSAKEPIALTAVVALPGEASNSTETAAAMDEHRLMQVSMFASSNPAKAEAIAETIQDPGPRAVALATVAPEFRTSDPQKYEGWLKQSNNQLQSLPPGITKLKLMLALARDSMLAGDQKRAMELFQKAFDLGEELFAEDLRSNPGKMAYEGTGEEELAKLSEVFAKYPDTRVATMARVRSTRDDVLKARLLVAAAKGAAPASAS